MKWGAPTKGKKKVEEKSTEVSDSYIKDFLMGRYGKASDIVIGAGYELGGAYEDWGFGIYRKQPDGTIKILTEGKTMEEAISKAIKEIRK